MESNPHEGRPEESEQLPEEAPPEQVEGDDDRERGSAPDRAGSEGRDDGRTATGNPRSAGST